MRHRGDHQLLGLGGLAGHAESTRPLPLVHCTAGRKRVDFAMLGQDDLEAVGEMRQPRGVLERSAHPRASCTPTPSSVNMRTPLRTSSPSEQRFAIAIDGDRRRRHHLTEGVDAEIMDLTNDRSAVDRRRGVGITTTAVNPPSAAPREPVWMVSPLRRQVHESAPEGRRTGGDDKAVGVDDRVAVELLPHLGNHAVLDQEVSAASARRRPGCRW